MQTSLDQEGVATVDQAKDRIHQLAIVQAVILFGITFILAPILDLDILRKVPGVPILGDAMPRVTGGSFFYFCVAIIAAACGAYGFGVRSWSLIVLGFWMVMINAVAMAASGVIYALKGGWHILASFFYLISEWGFGEMTRYHFVGILSCLISIAIAYVVVRLALAAVRPAFHGALLVGRAQELDSSLIDFLAPFEGKGQAEVLAQLFRNSLSRFLTYSLVGHFAVITVFSIPGFMSKAQEAWNEAREFAQRTEPEKKKPPVKTDGEKGDKEKGDGEDGKEPDVKFDTPAATEKPGDDDDIDFDDDDEDTKPTGDSEDYEKHKGKKPDAGDPDFDALDGGMDGF